jgi:hypothetical protein
MNHRPFEDWLLEDQTLTPEQNHELQSHLRVCNSCTSIAESNVALRATRRISPAAGFTERFQTRLVARRRQDRWRQIIGSIVLVAGGTGLVAWLAGPAIQEMLRSPAHWITIVVGYFLFVLTSIQALSEVGSVLVRVLYGFISPTGWFIAALIGGGLAMLWTVSIWRFARIPRGV